MTGWQDSRVGEGARVFPHSPGLELEEPSPGNSGLAAPAARPRPWPSPANAGLPPSLLLALLAHQRVNSMVFCAAPAALATLAVTLVSGCVPAALRAVIPGDALCTWRGAGTSPPRSALHAHVRRAGVGRGGPISCGPRACSLTASARGSLANQGKWPLGDVSGRESVPSGS